MNEHIMKILFGNQKQAKKQNEAIANFVAEYMCGVPEERESLNTYDGALNAITQELTYLVNSNNAADWKLTDKLFVQYLLGMDAYKALTQDVPCNLLMNTVLNSPKVVFSVDVNADIPMNGIEPAIARDIRTRAEASQTAEAQMALTLEDEAYELAHKMMEVCPPARRGTLPEDEVLAAILFGGEYYSVQ